MNEPARSFINHLQKLSESNRGALAHLKRSLGFAPGAYPPAFPHVERFVGADRRADDPWRQALYLTAGLYARHPMHKEGVRLAAALGKLGHERGSDSVEQRFIALLAADPTSLPPLLRQVVSLLAADGLACDYVALLENLARWLKPHASESRDRLRQQWARDFYRHFEPHNEIKS